MDNYPLLNIFWTMLELFLWILWFFLLFKIITDIFRSHDMGGGAKAAWTILVILLPFLGVLLYLIVRGGSMHERDLAQAKQADAAFQEYVRKAAGTGGGPAPSGGSSGGHVADLARLADLKNSGALTEEEYQRAKDKLLT
ncbi:putative oligomerization/nucleic acid binding protein [Kitasatospora sp. SolWspMP-SS2h]|uniref:SHOCT domain-containing protein n=1 Tax=Kitasatospora sp. SolWspMP-SS2h TaxID=1305729 RepID=UPI000DB9595A|nr:SHOCT domain-containing protein [Kitasatospora sp. SolWspMP-SS2h]RAJ38793.1 putative oligomerization/nucleic acid binding protein [Kitasatospora sp. SolWspMP-SS2h]